MTGMLAVQHKPYRRGGKFHVRNMPTRVVTHVWVGRISLNVHMTGSDERNSFPFAETFDEDEPLARAALEPCSPCPGQT